MKSSNIFIALVFIATIITSCKKEKTDDLPPTTPAAPTSNYYVFDGTTYTGNLGSFSGITYSFFCSGQSGTRQLSLIFYPAVPGTPPAGTYAVRDTIMNLDSTNCTVLVKNDTLNYYGTGVGTVTVGKSGTSTTYKFSNIPLTGGKTVSGDFIH